MEEHYYDSFSDPRITGSEVVRINLNKQLPEVYGAMWCTTRLENDGGYWESTAVGYRTAEGGPVFTRSIMAMRPTRGCRPGWTFPVTIRPTRSGLTASSWSLAESRQDALRAAQ
jgi:hypothetical protein